MRPSEDAYVVPFSIPCSLQLSLTHEGRVLPITMVMGSGLVLQDGFGAPLAVSRRSQRGASRVDSEGKLVEVRPLALVLQFDPVDTVVIEPLVIPGIGTTERVEVSFAGRSSAEVELQLK